MPEISGKITVSGQSHITIVHEFFSQTSVRCYLESTVYPSHVREILFLSCLIHDFPSIYERGGRRIVDHVALSRRSTLRFVPFIVGKMQGTLYRTMHRRFQFSRVHREIPRDNFYDSMGETNGG